MDPYQILGVSRNATDDEIKKAYRKLSRKYHPDANVNNPNKDKAEEQFKRIQQAYKQIMDERSGASYGNGSGSYSQSYGQGYGQGYGQNRQQQGYGGSYSQQGGYSQGNGSGGYGGWWGGFGPFGGFGGFGGFNSGAGESQRWGNDDLSVRLKGAANYVNNGSYNEAINALNSISQRDARWYYVHAMADAGLGNSTAALENATIAVQMDPDNMTYQSLYNNLRGGGAYYAGQGQRYGRSAGMNQTKCCMACLAMSAASSCCAYAGGGAGMQRGFFCC